MKTFATLTVTMLFALVVVTPVYAQQPGAATDPHHPAPPAGASPSPAPAPGMKPEAMPMMDMCRQMMGGMPSAPMMSDGMPTDPKERAAMLEMRGEMMKAMGDVMMKHAHRMKETTR